MCAGTSHFDTYCGPFLASFERAYGSAAADHRVVVFTTRVERSYLSEARERFSPWAHFEELGGGELGDRAGEGLFDEHAASGDASMVCVAGENGMPSCSVAQDVLENRTEKVMQNNKWFTLHVAEYLKTHSGQGFCNAMLIDSDTLFVRPVGGYLVDCRVSPDWDVGFTVYDPEFVVPWASDSAQVGRTRGKGFSRINTGVVLLNLRAPRAVQDFLVRWAQATIWLTSSGEEDIGHTWQEPDLLRWQHWHDELVEEFKGPNQASMALLVCSYQIDRLGDAIGWGAACAACRGPVEARLDLIDGERAMPVRFRALPARVLNHPESMPEGAFPPDLAVVHLKGLWWRLALPSGRARFVDHFRRSEWNRDALTLHRLCYETWRLALELRLPTEDPAR